MIANCPSCGTHYKHEPPKIKVRARCGRCAAGVDLARLSPYRIVPASSPRREDVERAAGYSRVGLDDPALATTIARNVGHPAAKPAPVLPLDRTRDNDPLPQIPQATPLGAYPIAVPEVAGRDILPDVEDESPVRTAQGGETAAAPSPARDGAATFVLWVAAGAIVGTGISWTMGGTTTIGMALGAVLGTAAGWGWLRWTSPK